LNSRAARAVGGQPQGSFRRTFKVPALQADFQTANLLLVASLVLLRGIEPLTY
jgi:hypothetical protein